MKMVGWINYEIYLKIFGGDFVFNIFKFVIVLISLINFVIRFGLVSEIDS